MTQLLIKAMPWFRRLFFLLLILITILSLIPNPQDVPGSNWLAEFFSRFIFGDIDHADKVNHFIAYGVLSGTAGLAGLTLWGRKTLVMLALILWSGGLELLQGLTGKRTPDWADMVANGSGVIIGAVAAALLLFILSRLKDSRS